METYRPESNSPCWNEAWGFLAKDMQKFLEQKVLGRDKERVRAAWGKVRAGLQDEYPSVETLEALKYLVNREEVKAPRFDYRMQSGDQIWRYNGMQQGSSTCDLTGATGTGWFHLFVHGDVDGEKMVRRYWANVLPPVVTIPVNQKYVDVGEPF